MSDDTSLALITSAAYVNAELAAEFGQLPPCFLPFGHKRLFGAQVASLAGRAARTVLTLPASFQPGSWELARLREDGVEVISIPDGLSLGESIQYALTLCDARGTVSILHGDTLFLDPLPEETDVVGVATTQDAYAWGAVEATGRRFVNRRPAATELGESVLTGWFSFRSAPAFLRALTLSRGDFLGALDAYSAEHPLQSREVGGWLDFGHLQTFHRARARVSTARSFNSIAISNRSVLKTGEKPDKLAAEANWFANVPPPMRLHTPAFLGHENGGYRIGYEFSPTLHELFVFGALEPAAWRQIMEGCFDYLGACVRNGGEGAAAVAPDALRALALDKTGARLETWAAAAGVSLDDEWQYNGRPLPSLRRIAAEAGRLAADSRPIAGVMQGDFCFPNAFFDFRQRLVKVIDPRGSVRDGTHTVFGDLRYDLAKMNHSIEGYDLILAGRYMLEGAGTRSVTLNLSREGAAAFLPQVASEFELEGRRVSDRGIAALTVHLFLSMLPLHADRPDRQQAFLANALRLYANLENAA
ncbi:capsular biosynthesis protein [Roseomonas elaeocarpi]|uniref:Capsular biosynthesis protein n=1 Tax=Roseomonas elaeocarpi TaxID=907779 RepID=A0ABV6JVF3_9PROT